MVSGAEAPQGQSDLTVGACTPVPLQSGHGPAQHRTPRAQLALAHLPGNDVGARDPDEPCRSQRGARRPSGVRGLEASAHASRPSIESSVPSARVFSPMRFPPASRSAVSGKVPPPGLGSPTVGLVTVSGGDDRAGAESGRPCHDVRWSRGGSPECRQRSARGTGSPRRCAVTGTARGVAGAVR